MRPRESTHARRHVSRCAGRHDDDAGVERVPDDRRGGARHARGGLARTDEPHGPTMPRERAPVRRPEHESAAFACEHPRD